MIETNSILFLPSLNEYKLLEIRYLDLEEAKHYVNEHTYRTINSKKTIDKAIDYMADHWSMHPVNMDVYIDILDLNEIACIRLYNQLLQDIRGLTKIVVDNEKYKRAVFVDPSSNTIGIGRTLIGKNAYINYVDHSMNQTLIDMNDNIDKLDYDATI